MNLSGAEADGTKEAEVNSKDPVCVHSVTNYIHQYKKAVVSGTGKPLQKDLTQILSAECLP